MNDNDVRSTNDDGASSLAELVHRCEELLADLELSGHMLAAARLSQVIDALKGR